MTYRGYPILRVPYQGTTCFRCPALPGREIAATLATMYRWIDRAIAAHELAPESNAILVTPALSGRTFNVIRRVRSAESDRSPYVELLASGFTTRPAADAWAEDFRRASNLTA